MSKAILFLKLRLQSKMQEERPRSADINKMNAEERSAEVRNLREQIVETFKTQMKLRRKLMEIDAHLLGIIKKKSLMKNPTKGCWPSSPE